KIQLVLNRGSFKEFNLFLKHVEKIQLVSKTR
ncbi:MAG: hypothetical protein ACI8RD_002379, partial [Bacillariaceae sp.]